MNTMGLSQVKSILYVTFGRHVVLQKLPNNSANIEYVEVPTAAFCMVMYVLVLKSIAEDE